MIEHKTLPGEIIVELRNLLISIVRKDARNDTDTLPGGNISWLNADRTLEDYPATFIVPPPKFADCIEYGEYYGELRDGSGFWIDCPLWTKEEGRSDLEVQLFARTAGDGVWDLDVTNILVP